MKSFEERKTEYLNKLKLNIDLVEKFLYDEKCQEIYDLNPNSAHIFLMPTTEEELRFANLCLCFAIDIVSFIKNLENDNIEKIDMENSELLKFYVESMNALKNRDESRIKELRYFYANRIFTESGAKFFYEESVASKLQEDDFADCLADKMGLDETNKLLRLQLQTIFNKELGSKITRCEDVEFLKAIDNLDTFANFVCEFHKIYSKGIKNQKTTGKIKQYKK